jgi:hypothetical protein
MLVMADYYFAVDVCLKAGSSHPALSGFRSLFPPDPDFFDFGVKSFALDVDKNSPTAYSESRKGVLLGHVSRLIDEFKADELSYLLTDAVALSPSDVGKAVDQLEWLFGQMRTYPERAASACWYPIDAQEVVDLAALPEESPIPDFLDDEEGEGFPYAIGYLKAHMAVLRYAQANGLILVHGQGL